MANIELDGGNKKITVDSGDLTLDIPGDIILDADGGDITFADGGTNLLKITNSSSDVVFQPQVDAKDIVFKQYDGTVVATVEDNATFNVPTGKLAINGTAITSTAAELNILDGVTATASELNLIDGGTARGTTAIADGDGVLINDAGTMRMTSVETLATYIGGGITTASQWRMTTTFAGDAAPIASNWEVSDSTAYASLGSAMSESSGIFTFPSTGYWFVRFTGMIKSDNAANRAAYNISATTNNSSYSQITEAQVFGANTGGSNTYASVSSEAIVDVTNTTNVKVRFHVVQEDNSNDTNCNTNYPQTGATFIRLGDT